MAQLDYANILQAGQSLVPDLRAETMRQQEIQARTDALRQRAMDARTAAERKAAFRQRLAGAMDSNDPRQISRLMMEFPEFADAIKPGFEAMSKEQQTRNLTQMGSAYQLAQTGDYKGAASVLRRRYEADNAAGQADETTRELLDALESGDPVQQRRAAATLGISIASTDPGKFNETYKALFPTERSSATLAEYDQRVAKFGKAAADKWLAVQDAKLVPVQKGGSVYSAADLVTPGANVPDQPEGGDPADPTEGVEPPPIGPNGFPTSLTPEQYRVTVQAMGKAETDSWMQRNGITMAGAPQQGTPTTSAVRVRSKQQYDRLPKGTRYIAPDGSERVKG